MRRAIATTLAELLILGAALAFLAGCGTHKVTGNAQAVTATSPVPAATAPAGLVIPSLTLAANLAETGLTEAGAVQEPDVTHPEIAAWVTAGPTPGQTGRALIVGHVNGNGTPGVFADLATIKPGAEVLVTSADGKDVRFVVDEITQWSKDRFPTGKVYGDTPRPELALITCGGQFDQATGHYKDQIVVLAHQENAA